MAEAIPAIIGAVATVGSSAISANSGSGRNARLQQIQQAETTRLQQQKQLSERNTELDAENARGLRAGRGLRAALTNKGTGDLGVASEKLGG